MRKITSLLTLLLLFVVGSAQAQDMTPSVTGMKLTVGSAVSSFTATTGASDNDHWYLVAQTRNDPNHDTPTPVYDVGVGSGILKRAGAAVLPSTLTGTSTGESAKYLVRFISTGTEGVYKMQFATGNYINSSLNVTASASSAAEYLFYNCNSGTGSNFGWNLNDANKKIVDNNGPGYNIAFWETGTVSGTADVKNNVWQLYEVTLAVDPVLTIMDQVNTAVTSNIYKMQTFYGVSGADKITSPSSDSSWEGNLSNLIDNKADTYHHSDWHGTAATPHNMTYELTDATDAVRFYINQRANGTGQPYNVTVFGSNDNVTFDSITTANLAWTTAYGDLYSQAFSASTSYKYWRITVKSSYHTAGLADLTANSWYCASEFYVLPNNDVVNTLFEAENAYRAGSVTDATAAQTMLDNVNTQITAMNNSSVNITYQVVDGSNNVLFTSNPVEVASGTVITELPADYQKTDFYSYNTVSETVTGDKTITFTATELQTPLVKYSATVADATWYYLTMRPGTSAAYPTYVSGGTPNVTLPATDAHNETTAWAFVGSPYAGFQVYNKAAGTSVVLGSATAADDGNTGGNTYATLAAPGSQTYELWTITASSHATGGFFLNNAAGQYLNKRSNSNLAYWTGGHDQGSTFVGEEILEGQAQYEALLAQVQAINFGSGVNQYSLPGYEGQEANIIAGIEAAAASDYAAASTALQAMIDSKVINTPAAGFYRIKGNTNSKYLASGNNASNGKYNMSTATDASTIFYFDGSHLTNYGSGQANGMHAHSWNWVYGEANASTVTFEDGATNGGYAIKSNDAYFFDGGTSADRGGTKDSRPNYNSWYLEEVTTLPFSISAAEQATICLPVAFTVPSGVKVRYANRAHDGLLTVVECGTDEGVSAVSVVPANTPVILKGAEGAYDLVLTTTTETLSGNVLTSTSNCGVAVAAETTAYILALNGTEVVFAKLADTDRNIAGFKAYFVLTTGGDAPQYLFFDEGEVTGINAVNAAAQNGAAVYDLQGRRVSAAAKGVYIVNGKKVLVK